MNELIQTCFFKYDDSIKNYSDLINHNKKQYLMDQSKITVVDGVIKFFGNEDFHLDCFFLGSYNHNEKVWIWNWCYPLPKKNNLLGHELINYALNFNENKINRDDFVFIRSILVNSRIQINNDFNIELLQGLIMFITNVKVIIPIKATVGEENLTYYYGIKNPGNKIY